jgi:hypothetical protein
MNRNEVFAVQAGAQLAALDWIYAFLTALPPEKQNQQAVEYLSSERRRTRGLLDIALARAQTTGRKAARRQKAGV